MKDFLDKGMGKCPFKYAFINVEKQGQYIKKKVIAVCPESAVINGIRICLRNDKAVLDLKGCPRKPHKIKPTAPPQPELPGMPND